MRRSTRSARPVRSRLLAAAAVLATAAAACSSSPSRPAASGGTPFVGLRSAAPTLLQEDRSCDDVLDSFQEFAPAVLRDRFGFGFGTAAGGFDVAAEADMGAPASGAATDDAGDAGFAPDSSRAGDGGTSDTNTQEEGIDEPDVVETDGDFVYVVDQDELVILDGATGAVRSRLRLASHGAQLLLQGDRLLAITGGGGWFGGPGVAIPDVAIDVAPGGTTSGGADLPAEAEPVDPVDPVDPVEPLEPTEPAPVEPGEEPEPAPEPRPVPLPEPEPKPEPVPEPIPVDPPRFPVGTVIQLIDVADRGAPRILQTTEIEGQHVTTRVVDGVARVVVTSWPEPPMMDIAPAIESRLGGRGLDQGDLEDFMADVEAAISDEIAETAIGDWLPSFRSTVLPEDGAAAGPASTVEGSIVACEDVLVPEVNAGIAETSILRVDFEDGFDPADTTTVVAEAGTVYASQATLYLAATKWVPLVEQQRIVAEDWSTALHAFDLRGDGAAVHIGAGEVPGSTLNQYSLSEYDGHLRIATTEGTPWGRGPESQSGVRVLRLDGDQLVEVGAVTGLGVTETIQSVRFMGPVGYVVTFRQTDPLYVIDLADPTAPEAVGELKIPGFSSYLHPIGDGQLVGIGRDADLEGRDQGLLVSLFDVSDPTAPTQVQTYTERDAWSSAGNDPKAFLWWAPESTVIVPVERYGVAGATDAGVTDDAAFEAEFDVGMLVLDVSRSGITERAVVRHEGRYPYRAVVVQDRLWSLFDGGALVSDFANPAQGTFTGYR